MGNSSKLLFLLLIGLYEFLEIAGSREGLLALWVGVADTWWIQQTGASAIVVLLATGIPTLAYYYWSDNV